MLSNLCLGLRVDTVRAVVAADAASAIAIAITPSLLSSESVANIPQFRFHILLRYPWMILIHVHSHSFLLCMRSNLVIKEFVETGVSIFTIRRKSVSVSELFVFHPLYFVEE